MADIDEIISGVRGNTKADFSGLFSGPIDAYNAEKDQRAKNELRDAFKGGVPLTPDGQPDFGAMAKTLFQKGGLNEGLSATKTDLERQRLKYGMDSSSQDFPAGSAAPQSTIVSPPSSNRGASVPVAPPLNRGGETPQGQPQARGAPQGDQAGSIVGMVSGAGVPDELAGPIIQQVSAATRLDPNVAVNPQQSQRVQQIVAEAVRRTAAANQPQPPVATQGAPPVPPVAATPTSATPIDPTLGGLVPPGRTPQQQLELLSRRVAGGLLAPEVAKVYEARIKALQDALSPTPEMKNAAASGKSLEDYQNRGDEQTTQRDILTKSLLPKVDKSQESAVAARDDINAIHRSREELDQQGGVFSGAFAEQRLKLAKVAEFLGVPNADKIANTEAYGAAIGQRVAVMVKAFGSGTAISDGDRRFAAAMAGGQVTLDEKSMRRILDIGEKAARGKIDSHNKLVDDVVGSNDALKGAKSSYVVNAPGNYSKPDAIFSAARDAIAKGAPRDAVVKRLRDAGHDPSKL